MVHVVQVASRAYVVHVAAATKPTVTDKVGMCNGLPMQMAATICINPRLGHLQGSSNTQRAGSCCGTSSHVPVLM